MSEQPYLEKTVRLTDAGNGHKPLSATVTDAYGAMPIRITRGEHTVHLRWSEWDEIRDHIELAMPGMKPEPTAAAAEYTVCGDTPDQVPYDALPCILEEGHDTSTTNSAPSHHSDRRGRRW